MCLSCTCCPISVLCLTSTAAAAAAPIQLQKHPAAIRILYIIFVITVTSTIPHCHSKDLLTRKWRHTSTYLLEHPLKNVIEPHPVISWDSATTPASLWHSFYALFFFSTTASAACCLSADSLERSFLWKTSNPMANCSKGKLALTVPLGSIHLRPCCFLERHM